MRNGICTQQVNCFARKEIAGKYYICAILREAINDRPCPFSKPEREFTDGIHYPYSDAYLHKNKADDEDEEDDF